MFSPSENFYAIWRTQFAAANVLRDENSPPSERLLQAVWQHQRLRRDQLKTADGKIVRVFYPGFISVEGGPDFSNAVLQIDDMPPRSGDVEIDLRSAGWRAHGHDKNKIFKTSSSTSSGKATEPRTPARPQPRPGHRLWPCTIHSTHRWPN